MLLLILLMAVMLLVMLVTDAETAVSVKTVASGDVAVGNVSP